MVGELGAHMKMSIGDSIVKEDVIPRKMLDYYRLLGEKQNARYFFKKKKN